MKQFSEPSPYTREICFINTRYEELFCVPDGGIIRLLYGNGDFMYAICRYIDELYIEVNGQKFQKYDFALRMETCGIYFFPA